MAYINGEKVLRIDLVGNMNQEVDSIREIRAGNSVQFWVGEKADYDKISDAEKVANCVYIVTDDTTAADLQNELLKTTEKVKNITEEQPIVDYIVKQGETTDGWTWRKWNSGVAECWKTFIYTMTRVTITNTRYGYHCITSGYKFPKDLFIDMPFLDYNAGNDRGKGGLTGCGQGVVKAAKANATKEDTGYLYVDFPAGLYAQADWTLVGEKDTDKTYTFPEGQYLPIQVSIEAKGRWKEEE